MFKFRIRDIKPVYAELTSFIANDNFSDMVVVFIRKKNFQYSRLYIIIRYR